MRVIAGKYRGKKLASFQGMDIRPTSDRVKESLFGILSDRIVGASVLDLFAGSGNLGIECLSRGASFVHFNDLAQTSIDVLKKNLDSVRATGYTISKGDFRTCLTQKGAYDFIFIDPPYASDYGQEALCLIARGKLTDRGIAIFENEGEGAQIEGLELFDTRSYGRTKLHFYRNV
ncbi:MAG: 16S rRNA (guanine(966)-N(2))-methyltransferase RsmD [Clostridia bacterium]|nr:16S rRNA (guanine(966)-N(2))-methyltransferase RsmD [Clostridia bacterium]